VKVNWTKLEQLFIGPCESSVFIRETSHCKFIIACQQLRIRDSTNLDILLFINAGQPVIESATNIRFSAFNYSYLNLSAQFEAAKFNVWNTEWDNVHDFTPDQTPHWTYLAPNIKPGDLLKELKLVVPNQFINQDFSVCPITYGNRPKTQSKICFVAIFAPAHQYGFDLISRLKHLLECETIYLIRTRHCTLSKASCQALFGNDKASLIQALQGPIVGMEWAGADCAQIIMRTLQQVGCADKFYISVNDNEAQRLVSTFFQRFRPNT